ncbi:MAG: sulfatase [Gemmatimonadetes bacterium]|nr:sulfatase [Gemmatimonadota bacterium]
MLRSQRGYDAVATFKRSISLILLLGLILGVFSGLSHIRANDYGDQGLRHASLDVFVDHLNAAFFRFVITLIPAALALFLLYRIAPRSFRQVYAVLALALLILFVGSRGFFLEGWDFRSALGVSPEVWRGILSFFVTILAIGLARLLYDTSKALHAIIRVVPFRMILLVLFLLAAANSARYINHTKNFPRGPNVILLTVDALRPDRLGSQGRLSSPTPNVDRIAAQGIQFANAYTTSPRTTQALATILTGRYPQTTGVRRLWDRLEDREMTVTEILADRGYDTGGFASLPAPDDEFGFAQGFQKFAAYPAGGAGAITNAAIDWLDSRKDRPFFLWMHYDDPKMPYCPPSQELIDIDPLYNGAFPHCFDYTPSRGCVVFGLSRFDSTETAQIERLYDSEIRAVDREIGKLLAALEREDRLHNSLILLTGTSGESLGEHGYYYDHGELLYDPVIQVPLIIRAENLPRMMIESQVRNLDIVPTLLDILHFDVSDRFEGVSLMRLVQRESSAEILPVFVESGESLTPRFNHSRPIPTIGGKLRAVRDGRWKLIQTPAPGDDRVELYDLHTDPAETLNVATDNPETVRTLTNELNAWIAKTPADTLVDGGELPSWLASENVNVYP